MPSQYCYEDVDMTAAGLTITPQRMEAVDFTLPFWGLVNGILIHTVDREWFPFINPFKPKVRYTVDREWSPSSWARLCL